MAAHLALNLVVKLVCVWAGYLVGMRDGKWADQMAASTDDIEVA